MVPLLRLITEAAYDVGAYHVDVILADPHTDRIRLERASEPSLVHVPAWSLKRSMDVIERGGATVSVVAPEPDLLASQDPARVAALSRAAARASQPFFDALGRSQMNWLGVNVPSEAWADLVFPDLPAEQRMTHLWEALIQILRLDRPDPIAAWRNHVAALNARCDFLNTRRYRALRFSGPGTDLTIGLADDHRWAGGSELTQSGIEFTPNLPTEEVFTLPDRRVAEGVVRSSKALSLRGVLIEDFSLTFQDGKVVNLRAARGEETLRRLIATDEGASRLGEVALVPASSPIARQNLLFYSTLLDENAASHLALGRGLEIATSAGPKISQEDYMALGGNLSDIHVDFMVGSDEMDVDGIAANGREEALMRGGEWVTTI
jgi:aminopeptidase